MERSYRIFDVFTDRPLSGNPLAIVTDGRDLNAAEMQAIAREFNLSETVFVLPPDDPRNVAWLRIFSPEVELPFAGHPLIGTAVHFAMEGHLFDRPIGAEFTMETGIGPLPCVINRSEQGPIASIANDTALKRHHDLPLDLTAACLSLPRSAIKVDTHRPQMLSKGLPYLLVEISGADDLARCRPHIAAFTEAEARYPTGEGPLSIYAYWREDAHRIHARMFDPLSGIPEDPATGSAASALGAFLCQLGKGPVAFEILKGFDMGRPSRISIRAHSDAPSGSSVTLSGGAVLVMQGLLSL